MKNRDFCILDNKSPIKELVTFKNFPVYMGCVTTPVEEDLFFDQVWGCSNNEIVQLKNLIDPNILYENSHTPGSVGKIWQLHHQRFFNFIKENSFGVENYLEIGGASGNLWNNFSTLENKFTYSIIEPSDQVSTDSRLKYIKGFYEDQVFDKKYKCIIHSHLFEHVYNPINFLNKICNDLTEDGVQFISIPNMRFWLKKGYTNTINFEHTFYIDEFVLEYLLNKCGFVVENKVVDNHSIFIKASKSSNIEKVEFNFSYVKDLFLDYVNFLTTDVIDIKEKIVENKTYLFGAHIFSQTLLNFGLDENLVVSILDNDPSKQNKRLYGTKLFINSPEVLKNIPSPVVILRAGVYNEEIKLQLLNINSSIIFI
jgi:hypothetical protein